MLKRHNVYLLVFFFNRNIWRTSTSKTPKLLISGLLLQVYVYMMTFYYPNQKMTACLILVSCARACVCIQVSGLPVSEVMDTWTMQMGYPVLDLTVADGAKLTQKRFLLDSTADPKEPESPYESVWHKWSHNTLSCWYHLHGPVVQCLSWCMTCAMVKAPHLVHKCMNKNI